MEAKGEITKGYSELDVQFIEPSVELLTNLESEDVYNFIEMAGRTCYKSTPNGVPDKFVNNLVKVGHHSVLEHVSLTFRIICDRGVSHEIVRHRIASYSQESTRYVNYKNKGYQIVNPAVHLTSEQRLEWEIVTKMAVHGYERLLDIGQTPEVARALLPNALKTEIVMTANLREWMHFIKLRTSCKSHPDMRSVAYMVEAILKAKYPAIFV